MRKFQFKIILLMEFSTICLFTSLNHRNGIPGSQLVSEKWSFSWNAFLVSQKNYIVVEVDGRGTGFQGESVRHAIYKKLGESDSIQICLILKNIL